MEREERRRENPQREKPQKEKRRIEENHNETKWPIVSQEDIGWMGSYD